MRDSLLLALALAVVATASSAGSLRLETADGSRPVWIDGSYVGNTPIALDSLPPGSSEIAIGEPADGAVWVRPWIVRIPSAQAGSVSLELGSLQRLRITSEPVAARVLLEGEVQGWTPLHLLVPASGPQRFSFEAPGGRTEVLYDGQGRPDSTLRVSVPLPKPAASDTPRLEPTLTWGERVRVLLPVSAVVLGVIGVWARQTADRAYDDYTQTVDRERMQNQLDRVRTYDRVATGFWLGAEVCLAGAAWSWLRASGRDSWLRVELDPEGGGARAGVSLHLLGRQRESEEKTE